jgi:hypothetical protein
MVDSKKKLDPGGKTSLEVLTERYKILFHRVKKRP